MVNLMKIEGRRVIIQYDPEIEMFRGEFIDLNGSADFYAKDIDGLYKEGAISLKVFLEACEARGIKPEKEYSGEFNILITPELHAEVVTVAAVEGKSLNQWVFDALDRAVHV
jgi:predicted HicB family RNase H-like nuclease